MSRYSVEEFIDSTSPSEKGERVFELETERLLEVNLDGLVWMKKGTMVAYIGDIQFTREGIFEHGAGKLLKRFVSSEGVMLTKAEGRGKLYLADRGKKICVLNLEGQCIYVNGNDVLAFEQGVEYEIKMMKKISAILSGGLFNVRLEGKGMVAITTHYEPVTLKVAPDRPVITDPNATVCWSGTLQPEFKTDISLKTFFGRGSAESFQMYFEGDGFVVIQPYEEIYLASTQG